MTRTMRELKAERNAPEPHDVQRPPRERVNSYRDSGRGPAAGTDYLRSKAIVFRISSES